MLCFFIKTKSISYLALVEADTVNEDIYISFKCQLLSFSRSNFTQHELLEFTFKCQLLGFSLYQS